MKSPFHRTLLLTAWLAGATDYCAGAEAPFEGVAEEGVLESSALPTVIGLQAQAPSTNVSPTALLASANGGRLFIAVAGVDQVAVLDTTTHQITQQMAVPSAPSGLALSRDESRLYVVCAAPESTLCVVDVNQWRLIDRFALGHTALAPVLSPDGKTLYICNRFDDEVVAIDLERGNEAWRIRVRREPVAAAITPDGKLLIVANHLPAGTANHLHAGAVLSVVDTATQSVVKELALSLGASLLRGVGVSPDGRFAAVTHLRGLFWLTTSTTDLGRINSNALTVIDLKSLRVIGTLLLDQTGRGAATPWAVAWTPDSKTIVVTHAGTHEISLIDAPQDSNPWSFPRLFLAAYSGYPLADSKPTGAYHGRLPKPPTHPVRVRCRIPLPGNGPRALAVVGSEVYVANYFSGDLSRIDITARELLAETVSLGPVPEPSLARKGEMHFNDARLCSGGWQSCASCHDDDARADGLNWDLLNDGAGNPKNTKSLVWAHQTAPAMALGVRTNAEAAVRAGLHHILFTDQPEDVSTAIDTYLQSLKPARSPCAQKGLLSPAAERGRELFESPQTGCQRCHPAPLFTDRAAYDVGTGAVYKGMWGMVETDPAHIRFDTPALVELWRTGPYLHDGSATTLREVLTTYNPNDLHGRTSHLSTTELDDLVEYLRSL